MKTLRNGRFCLSMMWIAAAVVAGGQEPPPQQPPAQQPPAQQPPAQQPPAQTPPSPEQAGTNQNVKLPPPPPKVIDVRMPGEAGIYIGLTGWQPNGNQYLDKGHASDFSGLSFLKLAHQTHAAFGAEVGVAAGLHNTIKASYWFDKNSGTVPAPTDLVVFGQVYPKGDGISTSSKLSNYKLSYEYLTWPYPVERRHFRLKTLWQMQYVTVRTVFDDPIKSATPDVNGAFTSYAVLGSKSFFSPAFGLGIHEYGTRNLHFEANVSGFAWPHRFQLVDSEATVSYRVGHIALRGGFKFFHYRTSPKQDYFYRGTMAGVFVGIRWHSD